MWEIGFTKLGNPSRNQSFALPHHLPLPKNVRRPSTWSRITFSRARAIFTHTTKLLTGQVVGDEWLPLLSAVAPLQPFRVWMETSTESPTGRKKCGLITPGYGSQPFCSEIHLLDANEGINRIRMTSICPVISSWARPPVRTFTLFLLSMSKAAMSESSRRIGQTRMNGKRI